MTHSIFRVTENPVEIDLLLPQTPETELHPVIEAFRKNHYRWQAICIVPEDAAVDGMEYATASRKVLWRKFGQPFIGDKEITPEILDELDESLREHSAHPTIGFVGDGPRKDHTLYLWPPIYWDLVFARWGLFRGQLGTNETPSILHEAQIVSAWTMFETLAGDIWKAAVNARPDPLARLTGKASRIDASTRKKAKVQATGTDSPSSDGGDSPTLKLWDIHELTEGTFDIANRMGDLLVLSDKVKFTALDAIRIAYSKAFSEKIKEWRTEKLDEALSDKGLDALSLVRNIIVHSAAKADAEYERKRKGVPIAPKLDKGDPLKLDAVEVRKLIDPVVRCCCQLITEVDKWLKHLPTKTKAPA